MTGFLQGIEAARAFVRIGVEDRVSETLATLRSRLTRLSNDIGRLGASAGRIGLGNTIFGSALAYGIKQTIDVASEATEINTAYAATFRELSGEAESFANVLSRRLNRDIIDVKRIQQSFFGLFAGNDFSRTFALSAANAFTQLSVDFSSFFNQSVDEAASRMLSALSNSAEVVQRFGFNVRAAALESAFADLGINKTIENASEQEKLLARAFILLQTSSADQLNVFGDVERTIDEYANQSRRLGAAFRIFQRSFGRPLELALAPIFGQLSKLLEGFAEIIRQNPQLVARIAVLTAALVAGGTALLSFGFALRVVAFSLGPLLSPIVALMTMLVRLPDLLIRPAFHLAELARVASRPLTYGLSLAVAGVDAISASLVQMANTAVVASQTGLSALVPALSAVVVWVQRSVGAFALLRLGILQTIVQSLVAATTAVTGFAARATGAFASLLPGAAAFAAIGLGANQAAQSVGTAAGNMSGAVSTAASGIQEGVSAAQNALSRLGDVDVPDLPDIPDVPPQPPTFGVDPRRPDTPRPAPPDIPDVPPFAGRTQYSGSFVRDVEEWVRQSGNFTREEIDAIMAYLRQQMTVFFDDFQRRLGSTGRLIRGQSLEPSRSGAEQPRQPRLGYSGIAPVPSRPQIPRIGFEDRRARVIPPPRLEFRPRPQRLLPFFEKSPIERALIAIRGSVTRFTSATSKSWSTFTTGVRGATSDLVRNARTTASAVTRSYRQLQRTLSERVRLGANAAYLATARAVAAIQAPARLTRIRISQVFEAISQAPRTDGLQAGRRAFTSLSQAASTAVLGLQRLTGSLAESIGIYARLMARSTSVAFARTMILIRTVVFGTGAVVTSFLTSMTAAVSAFAISTSRNLTTFASEFSRSIYALATALVQTLIGALAQTFPRLFAFSYVLARVAFVAGVTAVNGIRRLGQAIVRLLLPALATAGLALRRLAFRGLSVLAVHLAITLGYMRTFAVFLLAKLGGALVTVGLFLAPLLLKVALFAALIGGAALIVKQFGSAVAAAMSTATQAVFAFVSQASATIGAVFSEVFAFMKQRLFQLWQTASETFSGMADAIAAGNMTLVFEIAVAGMKVAWYQFTSAFLRRWQETIIAFIQGIISAKGFFTEYFIRIMDFGRNVARVIGDMFNQAFDFVGSLLNPWKSTALSMIDSLGELKVWFLKVFSEIATYVKGVFGDIDSAGITTVDGLSRKLVSTLEDFGAVPEGTLETLNEDIDRKKKKREEEAAKRKADTEAKVAQAREDAKAASDAVASKIRSVIDGQVASLANSEDLLDKLKEQAAKQSEAPVLPELDNGAAFSELLKQGGNGAGAGIDVARTLKAVSVSSTAGTDAIVRGINAVGFKTQEKLQAETNKLLAGLPQKFGKEVGEQITNGFEEADGERPFRTA